MTERDATKPDVFIIESLKFAEEEGYREGQAIAGSLRFSLKAPIYRYVRTVKELQHFVDEFDDSGYRYLHVSCHGNRSGVALTLENLSTEEFAAIVGPALEKRRLFLSTCQASTMEMAEAVFAHSACYSVTGPVNKINFDDSVIFWTSFYHLMFKTNDRAMKRGLIERTITHCAATVGEQIAHHTRDKDKGVSRNVLPKSP